MNSSTESHTVTESPPDTAMQYRGLNHVALVARDMAETVDFYTDVLEMPLVKTLDLPGGRGQHFFFGCGGNATVAFFWFPNAPEAAPGIASQSSDPAQGFQSAHASMNHLALDIPLEKFDEYAARLRRKGVEVHEINHNDAPHPDSRHPNEHTWVRSMYFRDPNGIALELASFTRPFTAEDVQHAPVDAAGVRRSSIGSKLAANSLQIRSR